jgi:site-specific DNA-methyltransferase (adenine-specific)
MGKQYTARKKQGERKDITSDHNDHKLTAEKIAIEQNTSSPTVRRAETYSAAVDTIVKNVGIDTLKQKILSGRDIKSTKKDMIELSKKPIETQKEIIETIVLKENKKDVKTLLQDHDLQERRDVLSKKYTDAKKIPDTITLYHGDFLKEYMKIPKGSVDCIITDPPYVNEWLSNYKAFAIASEYVLKPGGFLVSYVGHIHLDKILEQMTPHIDYFWIAMLKHAGTNKAVHSRSVQCGMKPILIMQKPPKTQPKRYFNDVILGTGKEKDAHEWQQGEEELRQIFEPFTDPGDTILDPFMGSGTTLSMAKKLNRLAIGFDIDATNVEIVKGRLME